MFAAVIQARLGSQRCKNKMLRDFAGTNLVTIALEKFSRSNSSFKLYFAAYEEELLDVGRQFPCVLLKRNEESANGERIEVVMNYLSEIPEKYVVFINACCPFLSLEDIESAIEEFNKVGAASLTAVTRTHTWYYREDGTPINFLDPTDLNTKNSTQLLAVTHGIHIFDRERFLEHGYFWNHSEKDPVFFEISHEASLDIDTEMDFRIAEAYFSKYFTGVKN